MPIEYTTRFGQLWATDPDTPNADPGELSKQQVAMNIANLIRDIPQTDIESILSNVERHGAFQDLSGRPWDSQAGVDYVRAIRQVLSFTVGSRTPLPGELATLIKNVLESYDSMEGESMFSAIQAAMVEMPTWDPIRIQRPNEPSVRAVVEFNRVIHSLDEQRYLSLEATKRRLKNEAAALREEVALVQAELVNCQREIEEYEAEYNIVAMAQIGNREIYITTGDDTVTSHALP